MEANGNILSYKTILDDVKRFTGRLKDNGYGKFDDPRHVYFKIIFYFNNKGNSVESWTSNLLGLDLGSGEDVITDITNKTYEANNWDKSTVTTSAGNSVNTAYNYLLLNDELERAEYLKRFILLLSEISSNSPWVFQSISGLDAAMDRTFYKDAVIPDDKKQLTIKCLTDSYDNKISTLLDLYRAACFSHINKKEIVPSNLRKFDMGVYVFSSPIQTIHSMFTDYLNTASSDGSSSTAPDLNVETLLKGVVTGVDVGAASGYFTSCKYFEFQNCEFDMNNGKDAYSEMTINESKTLEHNIVINYDDMFESNYNEFLTLSIGDFVALDMIENYANLETIRTSNEIRESDITASGKDKLNIINTNNDTSFKESNIFATYMKTLKEKVMTRSNNGLGEIGKSYDPFEDDYVSGTFQRDFSSNSADREMYDERTGGTNMIGKTWVESDKDYKMVDKATTNSNFLTQAVGAGVSYVENKVTSLLLGNAHGFSLSNTVSDMSSGNVFTVVGSVSDNVSLLLNSSTPTVGGNAHSINNWTKISTSVNTNAHKK